MSFVNDGRAIVLESIRVGCTRAYRHENDRMIFCETEVHTALKAHAFSPAHLYVWDDLIFHVLFSGQCGVDPCPEARGGTTAHVRKGHGGPMAWLA